MSVSYNSIIHGFLSPLDVVAVLKNNYGGTSYSIHFPDGMHGFVQIVFNEEYSDEVKAMRPWDRPKHCKTRTMYMHIDGDCACDYTDITTEPMTYFSLGNFGDCAKIMAALTFEYGGYIKDEAKDDEWIEAIAKPEAACHD